MSVSKRPAMLTKKSCMECSKFITCPSCSDILWNPVQCEGCKKHYCKECIFMGKCKCGSKVKEPEVILNNLLEESKFACPNEGCNQNIMYSECEHHSDNCNHKLVSCKNADCKDIIKFGQLKEHITNFCKFQREKCVYCDNKIKKAELEEHKRNCPSRKIKCEYCQEIYEKKELEIHYGCCQNYPKICEKCECTYLRKDKEKHNCFNCFREELKKLKEDVKESKPSEKSQDIGKLWKGFELVVCPECKRMVQKGTVAKCSACSKPRCYKCIEYCRVCEKSVTCSTCLIYCPNCLVPVCQKCRDSPHCSLLHYFDFSSSHGAYLMIYDAEEPRKEFRRLKFSYSAAIDGIIDSVLVSDTVFLSGGRCVAENIYSDETVALSLRQLPKLSQKNLANMIEPKCSHRLVAINQKLIYSVGGEGSKGPLKACEVYDIKKDYWKKISSMNSARVGPTVFTKSNSVIFVGGGLSCEESAVEEYIIESNMWKSVKINFPMKMELGIGVYYRSELLLIFERDRTYEFDFKRINEVSKIPEEGSFVQSKPILFRNHVYLYNQKKKTILSYIIEEKKWKTIKENAY